MPDFLESPRFPGCPSFGFTSDPDYRVVITRTASGFEKRNRSWAMPLTRMTITIGPRVENEIQELLEFYHAVGGMAIAFRVKDYTDYKSCFVGDTPLVTDQPLVAVSGGHQLVKRYQFGTLTLDRYIYKPVSGTVTFTGGGVLDYTTGLITGGAGGTWGGEFDLPMRFDSTFPVEVANQRIESVQFALQEVRMEGGSE